MPRYFFHVIDGVSSTDTEGVEIASLAEARREAVRLSGAILSEHPGASGPRSSGGWTSPTRPA